MACGVPSVLLACLASLHTGYLTPKIERVISLLSASPVGEARCRCRKVWLTRIDYYYYYTGYLSYTVALEGAVTFQCMCSMLSVALGDNDSIADLQH
jgi:hypothetical protein